LKFNRATKIWGERLETPLSPIWLLFSVQGLRGLILIQPDSSNRLAFPSLNSLEEPEVKTRLTGWLEATEKALQDYFAGRLRGFDHLTLDLQGTGFQRRVWEALSQVPFGSKTTYKALAQSLNMPLGARAVGGALGANPIPIIIPCHRVVAADGSLGGFSSGLTNKRLLLAHEQVVMGKEPGMLLKADK
jgi:methylated-DNA-[protein]-cysteine S-methyltransferase